MSVGAKLLHALLIYCKIDIEKKFQELQIKAKDGDLEAGKQLKLRIAELETELKKDRKLIEMTAGNENGSDDGSDSEPSGDNLDEEELTKIISDEVDPAQAQKLQIIKKLEASNMKENPKLKQKTDSA